MSYEMRVVPFSLTLLLVLAAIPSIRGLPVAVKNVADCPLENYAVLIIVEAEKLAEEGVEPSNICILNDAGEPIPFWIIPETANSSRIAIYALIDYLAPGEQVALHVVSGDCAPTPEKMFLLFDDFEFLDERVWMVVWSSNIINATLDAKHGLYISATYLVTWQYVKLCSPVFNPPLAVEALMIPLTGYDHDVCLAVYELGTESFHAAEARGAYIHAWGWGSPGNDTGTLAWYRIAGPPGTQDYMWDVTNWGEGGASPVWEAGEAFIFSIGVCSEGVEYRVYKVDSKGIKKLLANWVDKGILNQTVIEVEQLNGGAYNFTQKAIVKWILVRPYVHPEPRVEVGVERVYESPLEPILRILSKPQNQILLIWSAMLIVGVVIFVTKVLRRGGE